MDQALLDGGYRCYTGENIDVYFNTAIWTYRSVKIDIDIFAGITAITPVQ